MRKNSSIEKCPESKRPIPGVYFLQSEGDGRPIKIGYSRNIAARVRNIVMSAPDEIQHIATLRGVPQSYEHHLHQVFSEYRRRAEWFHPVPELLSYIEAIQAGESVYPEDYVPAWEGCDPVPVVQYGWGANYYHAG